MVQTHVILRAECSHPIQVDFSVYKLSWDALLAPSAANGSRSSALEDMRGVAGTRSSKTGKAAAFGHENL